MLVVPEHGDVQTEVDAQLLAQLVCWWSARYLLVVHSFGGRGMM